jgi:hypothetical protein
MQWEAGFSHFFSIPAKFDQTKAQKVSLCQAAEHYDHAHGWILLPHFQFMLLISPYLKVVDNCWISTRIVFWSE